MSVSPGAADGDEDAASADKRSGSPLMVVSSSPQPAAVCAPVCVASRTPESPAQVMNCTEAMGGGDGPGCSLTVSTDGCLSIHPAIHPFITHTHTPADQ